jgi:hypothetical protein
MVSLSSGRVVPKTCKSWLCSDCSKWLRAAAQTYLVAGCASTDRDTHALTFLTLTDTASARMDLPAMAARWKATQKALQRRGWLSGGYAQAIEFQKRGALHPHVLMRAPREVAQLLPRRGEQKRDRSAWRLHFRELVPLVRELGWGPVCDWRQVDGQVLDVAGYAAKSLAGYATKEAHARFKAAGARRVRPLRASRDWVQGMTLADFQQGAGADPGPWQDVTQVCGRL